MANSETPRNAQKRWSGSALPSVSTPLAPHTNSRALLDNSGNVHIIRAANLPGRFNKRPTPFIRARMVPLAMVGPRARSAPAAAGRARQWLKRTCTILILMLIMPTLSGCFGAAPTPQPSNGNDQANEEGSGGTSNNETNDPAPGDNNTQAGGAINQIVTRPTPEFDGRFNTTGKTAHVRLEANETLRVHLINNAQNTVTSLWWDGDAAGAAAVALIPDRTDDPGPGCHLRGKYMVAGMTQQTPTGITGSQAVSMLHGEHLDATAYAFYAIANRPGTLTVGFGAELDVNVYGVSTRQTPDSFRHVPPPSPTQTTAEWDLELAQNGPNSIVMTVLNPMPSMLLGETSMATRTWMGDTLCAEAENDGLRFTKYGIGQGAQQSISTITWLQANEAPRWSGWFHTQSAVWFPAETVVYTDPAWHMSAISIPTWVP